eukprot:6178413-Pleurochrysis_carterae.AAC.1
MPVKASQVQCAVCLSSALTHCALRQPLSRACAHEVARWHCVAPCAIRTCARLILPHQSQACLGPIGASEELGFGDGHLLLIRVALPHPEAGKRVRSLAAAPKARVLSTVDVANCAASAEIVSV